jgi:CheY-like chemotaxis protein
MTQFLYVEDDPMSRQVLRILLTKVMDYNENDLTIFEDSANFMERLRALPTPPDVIFLDVHIEPHDGFAMLTMLRKDPAYCKVPVVAVTAGVMATDIERLKESGFSGMIGKPIRTRTFPSLIQRILDGDPVWFAT